MTYDLLDILIRKYKTLDTKLILPKHRRANFAKTVMSVLLNVMLLVTNTT